MTPVIIITSIACSNNTKPTNVEIQIANIKQDSLRSIFNAIVSKFDTSFQFINKTDTSIQFQTDTGIYSKFNVRDSINETNDESFYVIGYNPLNKTFIFYGVYWEHYETYFLNKTSGHLDTLWLDPIFSPNNKLAISQSMQYGMEYVPNGYQLWQFDNNKWEKLQEINQENWVPIDIKWLSNNQVIIKKMTVDNYLKNEGYVDSLCYFEIKSVN